MNKILVIMKLMRPYQWIKNLFCFVGVIFGKHFFEHYYILGSIKVFIAFCLAASAVYVLNDILDVKEDRAHPIKKNRPIASNLISIKLASIIYIVLIIIALLLAYWVNIDVFIIITSYILLNIYYSLYGKHIVILDVFIISFGFLLRVFSGTTAIGIRQSEWVILCTMLLTLFLGFAKRRAELLYCENKGHPPYLKRKILIHYEPKMLDIFLSITAACAILSYCLFTVFATHNQYLIYTAAFVIYGIFRYIFILYKKSGGQDTANDLLDDRHIIVNSILWIMSYVYILFN